MTPNDFLDDVVTRNVAHLGEVRGSYRRAVNALLTLDAFAGILFAHLKDLNFAPTSDDLEFRDLLARESYDFKIVRDAAFVLKHGELMGKRPRLVRKANRVLAHPGAFGGPTFDRSTFDADPVIWIETTDPNTSLQADVTALSVLNYFQTLIGRFENRPA
jgi:hypothetical protein